VANQKGWNGQNHHLRQPGAYLAAAGKHVLLIDADPQANATSSLGVDRRSLAHSIYDVLLNDVPANQTILLTKQLRLDLESRLRRRWPAPRLSWSGSCPASTAARVPGTDPVSIMTMS